MTIWWVQLHIITLVQRPISEARVQAINEEIHFTDARKLVEDGFFWASKGMVAALTAIAPMLALILSRGSTDAELDRQATPMLNAAQVLVHMHV